MIERLLEPAEQLLDQQDFWQHQAESLAVFRSPAESFLADV